MCSHFLPQPSMGPGGRGGTTLYEFVDGYGGDVTTYEDFLMSDSWPTRNGGVHPDFQMDWDGGQKAVLRFDLSSIPASAICISAKLYVYHSYTPEGGATVTINAYSMALANSGWIEGVGDIAIALEDEPCWNALQADGAEGVKTAWAGSAGCSTSGTDYEADSLGSVDVNPASAQGTEFIIELNTARIEEWFGETNTNYGLVLIASGGPGGPHLGSSDNPAVIWRPKLVVEYEV